MHLASKTADPLGLAATAASSLRVWGRVMFDIETARLLGRACQYVYDFPDPAWKVLGACATPVFKCNDAGAVPTSFATILRYDDFGVVAFQGTITRDPRQL